jgi:UDP-N-acetylglucosamine--dolichyl-phosphate N-acetylglucosaminephosphotransferase
MLDDPRQKMAHIIVYKIITTMYQYQICIVLVASAVLMLSLVMDPYYLVMLLGAGAIGWVLTNQFIHRLKVFMLRAEVFGLDINKKGSEAGEKPIPECVGFASAIAFLMVGLLYYSSTHYLTHLACFLTITCTIMLGFADDMLDLPWRYKLFFPFFIIIPAIRAY